jgi:hypothetical protein
VALAKNKRRKRRNDKTKAARRSSNECDKDVSQDSVTTGMKIKMKT